MAVSAKGSASNGRASADYRVGAELGDRIVRVAEFAEDLPGVLS